MGPAADSRTGESLCPGCGLSMPRGRSIPYDGYFNTTPECWGLFTEVVGAEFADAVLFGQVHQMTVDSYAVQHAGGGHPDKSVDIHLAGLHLVLEREMAPPRVPPILQRLAAAVDRWPHLQPPAMAGLPTIFEVASASSPLEHIERVRAWAAALWEAWAEHHDTVAALLARHLDRQT